MKINFKQIGLAISFSLASVLAYYQPIAKATDISLDGAKDPTKIEYYSCKNMSDKSVEYYDKLKENITKAFDKENYAPFNKSEQKRIEKVIECIGQGEGYGFFKVGTTNEIKAIVPLATKYAVIRSLLKMPSSVDTGGAEGYIGDVISAYKQTREFINIYYKRKDSTKEDTWVEFSKEKLGEVRKGIKALAESKFAKEANNLYDKDLGEVYIKAHRLNNILPVDISGDKKYEDVIKTSFNVTINNKFKKALQIINEIYEGYKSELNPSAPGYSDSSSSSSVSPSSSSGAESSKDVKVEEIVKVEVIKRSEINKDHPVDLGYEFVSKKNEVKDSPLVKGGHLVNASDVLASFDFHYADKNGKHYNGLAPTVIEIDLNKIPEVFNKIKASKSYSEAPIKFVHFKSGSSKYEIINPEKIENGKFVFKINNFSEFAFIKKDAKINNLVEEIAGVVENKQDNKKNENQKKSGYNGRLRAPNTGIVDEENPTGL